MTQMLPEVLVVIPVYAMYRELGLSDSLPALSLIDAAFILPICIWVLKNAFDSVPEEIYEAALIDGCPPLSALIRTLLPLSAPGMVAVSVVAFFLCVERIPVCGHADQLARKPPVIGGAGVAEGDAEHAD